MRSVLIAGIIAAGVVGANGTARAQTSPADLADMTLAELMEIEVLPGPDLAGDRAARGSGRWHFEYLYTRVRFKGYRDGTKGISTKSLLGAPPGERTFPILPVKIVQEAHLFQLSYDILDRTIVGVVLPFLKQRTDHISVVPEYEDFEIASDGIGDVSLLLSQRLWKREFDTMLATVGLSFPTGSINQQGDTPRDTGMASEQLPYTMQLGSGTYDVILGAKYAGRTDPPSWLEWLGSAGWGLQVVGKIRTGENSRDYRLGHLLLISAWLSATPLRWLEPSVRMRTQIWERIHGADTSIQLGTDPDVFPAPVTNPELFGGEKISILGGIKLTMPEGMLPEILDQIFGGTSVRVEAGAPVYQSLNGPQPEEDYRLSVAFSMTR